LRLLGVVEVDDLKELKDSDLDKLSLTDVEKRRYRRKAADIR